MSETRVLIVEDDFVVSESLRAELHEIGLRPLGPVSTGEKAIALAREAQPDVILMDVKLKGSMDGIAAAKIIRAQQDIPIIYLTSCADKNTLARAEATVPFGYLGKPYATEELQECITAALARHQAERQWSAGRERLVNKH